MYGSESSCLRGSYAVVALALSALMLTGCAARRPPHAVAADLGIPACPAGAAGALLSSEALQCWFEARHGRWRVVTHARHLEALVMDVAVDDLRDAEAIARHVVASERTAFSEILVYAHLEPRTPDAKVRRVRWTRGRGYDAFDFSRGAGPHGIMA